MNIDNPYNYPIPEFKPGMIIRITNTYLILNYFWGYNNWDDCDEFVYKCQTLCGPSLAYQSFGERCLLNHAKIIKGSR